MDKSKAEEIVIRLLTFATGLRYGSVSVTAKMHDGRVVQLIYTTTETTRVQEKNNQAEYLKSC